MSLHNLNTPNKQWLMYLNTLSSISGDDLTIKPDTRRNLVLEVSGNNNIFIKKGDISYNLTNYITEDASFSNVDISVNLNPLRTNNSSLGLPSKLWGNAYIRDISVTNMSVSGNMTISGTISNVIQIIPRLANDISSSLGSTTNIWQRAFIRDLSSISTINGITWPITGPAGPPGPTGPRGPTGPTGETGPAGPELRVNINTTLTDICNIRLTATRRIYQNISGSFNDPTWSAVNGYYGLAKHAYPSLNPLSSGDLAVRTWTGRRSANETTNWYAICWSPERSLFVAIANGGTNRVMTSPDGITWTSRTPSNDTLMWRAVCWSPQLSLFVAVSADGTNNIMTSPDGINWTGGTAPSIALLSVCWSPELSLFVAGGCIGANRITTSPDGITWNARQSANDTTAEWFSICWSPELRLFVAVSPVGNLPKIMTSPDGITWTGRTSADDSTIRLTSVCWSPELGLFVTVSQGGAAGKAVLTSPDGINWTGRLSPTSEWFGVCWSKELRLFAAVAIAGDRLMTSPNGINWTVRPSSNESNLWWSICWSSELGIFAAVSSDGTNKVMTSSLKGRPPTSYNLFDSSFNRIDENGKWDFLNMNVTTMTAGGSAVESDDRLKHNEIVITNGLDVIDRLTPKFYQKTQVLLDASYNGDLSSYAWNYEAGLIAQEVLQINDLSYVVSGGDYYEQKYNLITQTQDLSVNFYEPSANNYESSANNYEVSNNYYQQRGNNYESSANNYESSANNYEVSNNYYELSNNNYEISYNLIAQAYNLNYNSVFVYGLAAIKELHTKVKAQDTSILDDQLNDLIIRIEALESNNIL